MKPQARPDGFNKMITVRIGNIMTASGKAMLISPDEFRGAFDGAIGRNFVYEQLRAGSIKHIRVGRKMLILASEIEDWPKRMADEQQIH